MGKFDILTYRYAYNSTTIQHSRVIFTSDSADTVSSGLVRFQKFAHREYFVAWKFFAASTHPSEQLSIQNCQNNCRETAEALSLSKSFDSLSNSTIYTFLHFRCTLTFRTQSSTGIAPELYHPRRAHIRSIASNCHAIPNEILHLLKNKTSSHFCTCTLREYYPYL